MYHSFCGEPTLLVPFFLRFIRARMSARVQEPSGEGERESQADFESMEPMV